MYRQRKRCRALWISITLVMIFTSILFQPVSAQTQVYEKVDPSEIVSGQYVMVASNGYAPTILDGAWVLSENLYDPPEAPDTLTDVNSKFLWALDITEGQVQLTDSGKDSIAPKGGNDNGIKKGNYSWLLVDNEDGTVSFKGQGNDTVTLASNNGDDSKFRAYKNKTTTDNPSGFPSSFTLYRLQTPADAYRRFQGELVSGTYVMVLENGYAPTTYNDSWVDSNDLGIVPSQTPYLTPNGGLANGIWTIEVLNSGKVRLKDSQGVYIAPKKGDNNHLIQGRFDWDVIDNGNGTFTFRAGKEDTTACFAANMAVNTNYYGRFRAYQEKATASRPNTFPLQFTLYQVSNTITPGVAIPPVYIYEAYGGGGNLGATWKNDYVILINKGDEAVLLDGYYLHYASEKGDFLAANDMRTGLSGEIEAGGYYVIQQAAGSGGSMDLPNYDVEGSIKMSASAFQLALTYDNILPTSSGDENIIDFLGVGANAKRHLGTGPAQKLSNTESLQRKAYDKDNSTDYQVIQADGSNLDYLTISGPTPLLQPLEFTEVPTESWARGDAGLNFRLNGDSDNLLSVFVNGNILDESNYSVTSGSTIIILLTSYLENLTPGIHNLMVSFNAGKDVAGGEVETEFEIAASSEPPGTTPTGPGQTEPTPPSETEPSAPETSQPIPTEPTTPTVPLPTEPGGEDPQPPQTVAPETEVVPTGESIHWMLYGVFFILAAILVFLVSQKALRKVDKTR